MSFTVGVLVFFALVLDTSTDKKVEVIFSLPPVIPHRGLHQPADQKIALSSLCCPSEVIVHTMNLPP